MAIQFLNRFSTNINDLVAKAYNYECSRLDSEREHLSNLPDARKQSRSDRTKAILIPTMAFWAWHALYRSNPLGLLSLGSGYIAYRLFTAYNALNSKPQSKPQEVVGEPQRSPSGETEIFSDAASQSDRGGADIDRGTTSADEVADGPKRPRGRVTPLSSGPVTIETPNLGNFQAQVAKLRDAIICHDEVPGDIIIACRSCIRQLNEFYKQSKNPPELTASYELLKQVNHVCMGKATPQWLAEENRKALVQQAWNSASKQRHRSRCTLAQMVDTLVKEHPQNQKTEFAYGRFPGTMLEGPEVDDDENDIRTELLVLRLDLLTDGEELLSNRVYAFDSDDSVYSQQLDAAYLARVRDLEEEYRALPVEEDEKPSDLLPSLEMVRALLTAGPRERVKAYKDLETVHNERSSDKNIQHDEIRVELFSKNVWELRDIMLEGLTPLIKRYKKRAQPFFNHYNQLSIEKKNRLKPLLKLLKVVLTAKPEELRGAIHDLRAFKVTKDFSAYRPEAHLAKYMKEQVSTLCQELMDSRATTIDQYRAVYLNKLSLLERRFAELPPGNYQSLRERMQAMRKMIQPASDQERSENLAILQQRS